MKTLPLLLLLIAPAVAAPQQNPAPDPPVVVTSGEGMVQAVPDRAWIPVTAESRAGNPRDAQRRNAEAMTPVMDKLRSAGIPAEAIRTTGYDLQQEWDYVNNQRVSRGYVARNTIDVRVDTIDRIIMLIEMAVTNGAVFVGSSCLDVKNRAKLELQ